MSIKSGLAGVWTHWWSKKNCGLPPRPEWWGCPKNNLAEFGGRPPKPQKTRKFSILGHFGTFWAFWAILDHFEVRREFFFLSSPPQHKSKKNISESCTRGISDFSETYTRQIWKWTKSYTSEILKCQNFHFLRGQKNIFPHWNLDFAQKKKMPKIFLHPQDFF